MSLWLPRPHSAAVALRVLGGRHAPIVARSLPLATLYPLARDSVRYQRLPFAPLKVQRYASTDASTSSSDPKPDGPKDVAVPQEPLGTRVWKKVKHEAQHYWHGSKLLVSEVRIASRLQWKILHGGSLTRRERRQVCGLSHVKFTEAQ
jgi:LETM1 and EF-hand domain-containing protein 1, mitochondrial